MINKHVYKKDYKTKVTNTVQVPTIMKRLPETMSTMSIIKNIKIERHNYGLNREKELKVSHKVYLMVYSMSAPSGPTVGYWELLENELALGYVTKKHNKSFVK